MNNSIILSLQPRYSSAILKKKKTIELRKKIGKGFVPGRLIYLYASAPEQKIVGTAVIKALFCVPIEEIVSTYAKQADVEADFIRAYYQNHALGYAIELDRVRSLPEPIGIQALKRAGFHPPQSFCYLTPAVGALFKPR